LLGAAPEAIAAPGCGAPVGQFSTFDTTVAIVDNRGLVVDASN